MNVLRKLLHYTLGFIVLTAAAVLFYPEIEPVRYVAEIILFGIIAITVLTIISFYKEDELNMKAKKYLMNGFIIAILVPSFYTAGAFIHESQTSWSGGEIHWHADFEVLVANETGSLERLNLVDPVNYCKTSNKESQLMCKLNDRVGITKYHEHNDNRIHIEGTFNDRSEATLAAFFDTFNGKLSNNKLIIPTNDKVVSVTERGNMSLKIIVNRGVGKGRHWCVIGDDVADSITCDAWDLNSLAMAPSEYVISPHKRGATLDDVFIIYDNRTARYALQDLKEDGKYRGFGLLKRGEGF